MSDVFRYSIDVSDVLSCFQMFSGCSQGMLIRKANGQNASRVGFWGAGGGPFSLCISYRSGWSGGLGESTWLGQSIWLGESGWNVVPSWANSGYIFAI